MNYLSNIFCKYVKMFICFLTVIITFACAQKAGVFTDKTGQIIHRDFLQRNDNPNKKVELYWAKPESSAPAPAILYIHGHRDNKRLYGGKLFVDHGVLGAMVKLRGWVVASISQPGYGNSDGPPDFCGPSTQGAVLEAIRFLKSKPFVNPDKIALYGVSRGAIIASMVASKEPELAAVILVSGSYNLVNDYPTGLEGLNVNIRLESGIEHKSLVARSAIYHADSIKSPILIMHGENDDRFDSESAHELAKILVKNKVTVRLKVFSDTGHVIPIVLQRTELTPFLNKFVGPIISSGN